MKVKKMIKTAIATVPVPKYSSKMTVKEAREILNQFSPKPNGTCYTNQNRILSQYDLQIIIPAYNVENFIIECLQSVFSQKTKYNFLVTVVNDGSTDRTTNLIRDFQKTSQKANLEVIEQENRGFSGARNSAMRNLRGKYITFLDSDDVLAPGAIEALLSHKEDVVQGSWYTFYEDEKEIQKTSTLSGYPWGKIYRAEVLQHFQFPEGYWFEDTPISSILYGMKWSSSIIDNIVYGYRKNPNGITSTAGRSRRSIESYYITELCLQEYPLFHVAYDQRAYEKFLRQTLMNHSRIKHQPYKVQEAVLVLEAELLQKYFQDYHTQDSSLKDIEVALKNKYFWKYIQFSWTRV